MSAVMDAPPITSGDRLSLTLFVSLALHALVILGVGFAWTPPTAENPPPMIDITLAQNPQKQAPKDYDFLAEANQEGGGTSEKRVVPNRPKPLSTPGVSEGNSRADAAPSRSKPEPKHQAPQLTGHDKAKTRPEPKPSPKTKRKPDTSLATLIDSSRQVASRAEFTRASEEVDAHYPSKRRISARTKAHAAASYMRQWVRKVEEIGNLNYPSQARNRDLSGRLILEVTLRPDGSVYGTKVLRHSPYPALDQAALRIVDLAAPFSHVPKKVLNGNDLLVITRTWEFDNDRRFSAN